MEFAEITSIKAGYDFTLIAANFMYDLLFVFAIVALVFLSRKMSQKIKGNVYWILFSLVFVSFFRGYVIDFFAQVFSNTGFVLYYTYVMLSKRFYSQLVEFIVYAAFVACPFLFKIAESLFKGKPLHQGTLSSVKIGFQKTRGVAAKFVRPLFHFIS